MEENRVLSKFQVENGEKSKDFGDFGTEKIHGRLNPFLKWRLGCGEFRVAHMA